VENIILLHQLFVLGFCKVMIWRGGLSGYFVLDFCKLIIFGSDGGEHSMGGTGS
jgi:hypothetical protein